MSIDQLQIELDAFPSAVRPMQAVAAEAPFSSPEYLFEVKWDGLRCVLFVGPDREVRVQDRRLNDITPLLPEVTEAARQVASGSVLDGELVATDGEGRPDQQPLRRRLAGGGALAREIPLAFLAFDALYVEGKPLLRLPLHRRKTRLRRAVESGGHLYVPDYITGEGVELYEACLERGLEGVMAKHMESTYVPGQRSPFWLKVKAVKSDDFVVIGYTEGEPFGALLVGFYEEGRLLPCGAVGGGFENDDRSKIASALDGLSSSACPLSPPPVLTAPVRWCRPELVISVRYSEWAPDGTLRFPIFSALRPEIHPAECARHRPRVVLAGRTPPGTPAYDLTRFPF
jgi:DNA ligase D-like protein (predicted ligase)